MTPLTPQPAVAQPAVEYSPLTRVKRAAFVAIGTVAVGLGILGIILPGMPATVFFIIALGCYARSSERMYRWLLSRTWAAKSIQAAQDFKTNNALPTRIKIIAQTAAWSSAILMVFLSSKVHVQIIVALCAVSCSVAMAIIKTLPDARPARRWALTLRDIAQQLWFGALSGAAAGALWGLGARTIMRFVANLAGQPALLNIPAALSLIVATAVLGMWIGMVYAGLRRALPRNQWLRGLGWGIVICMTVGAMLYSLASVQADMLRVGPQYKSLIVALFVPNFLVSGLLNSLLFGRLEKRAV
jgi:uncharacterized protein